MTTKWISQIFSGGNGTKNVLTPPTGNGVENEAAQPAVTADEVAASTGQAAAEEAIDYNKYVVLLLYGKNSFNDQIYSYLKISLGGIEKLKAAVLVGNPFTPSDFGTIIAAGRGEPSDEVRAEISSQYYVLTAQTEDAAPPPAATVTEKKSWDEF